MLARHYWVEYEKMSKFIIDVHSRLDDSILLHKIIRKELFSTIERHDAADEKEFLQLAVLRHKKGKTFKPHAHVYKSYEGRMIAQESWVVIQGKVKIILYDLDDSIIYEDVLVTGDVSLTFRGGHNYEILEDDTLVYEYKTGPYLGQKLDKRMI